MILLDVNLLVYAFSVEAPENVAARDWLDDKLNGSARVGLPWHSLLGFVRLSSNPRVTAPHVSVPQAWAQARAWLAQPPVWIPQPTDRHADVLETALEQAPSSSKVSDCHLAALAIEHGLTLCSTDGDFARFSALRWENPLLG
ncbi:MAG: PIN domain-containing protein [Solirubrobacteraceae bacterium MAG38_C4-C5]|nr:PIN domain-containing protein [Candidatus Siliceabacter maunaloa]